MTLMCHLSKSFKSALINEHLGNSWIAVHHVNARWIITETVLRGTQLLKCTENSILAVLQKCVVRLDEFKWRKTTE